ncbi:MAG: gliding motility-associated C-terminal domain-containing protein [Chitinophagaceae bacterium]|nr:gliding motility-associated C-terminal domain-containing protein [Chitinophagaceae bacterium]
MKPQNLLFTLFLLLLNIRSQGQASVQNCLGAIPVCQNSYTQSSSYTGPGSLIELNASNQGCLTTGENNSVWYIINTATAGNLIFTITPASSSDYDFAVWDLTDKACSAIGSGLAPIRCNYASLANSTAGGLTGLSTSSSQASIGAGGGSFSSALPVTAGQTFVILINNASGSASGYTINFAGSTCQVIDNVPPTLKNDTITSGCIGATSMKVLLSENVLCSSLAANGSDFNLSPASVGITSASSTSCSGGGNYTNLITLNFSGPIPAGSYTLSIVNGSDGNTLIDNCNNAMVPGGTLTFTVQQPLKATVTTQFGCAGSPSGVITAGYIGGTPPVVYKLNSGAYSSNNTFSGLLAGTYTIYVKDINNCVDDTVVTLVQSPPVNIVSTVVTNPLCYGTNNGSVTITANGGNPPYTYNVNTGVYGTSNVINNLGPGNYIVHVKDANGCIDDMVIFLSSPGQISVNTLSITNTTCGSSNGAINVSAFGGTAPINYALNTGGFQTSGSYTGLAAGSYTIHIKDGNNCLKDTIVNVLSIGSVNISSVTVVQPSCAGNSGSLTINGSGGVTPYIYSINGTTFVSGNSFSSLSSGSYTVTIKDANGCTATSAATLTSPGNLHYQSATVISPTCIITGTITVVGTGGTTPYSYALNAGAYGASGTFTGLAAGTYTIHLKDNNNCVHDTIISLSVTQVPVITSFNIINPSCSFPTAGSIHANVSGGTPAYTYSINGGLFVSGSTFSGLSGGSYTITVKDANGCTNSSVATLNSANTLSFTSFAKTNVGCGGAPPGTITAVAGNGNPAYQYSLNGAAYQASGAYTGLAAGTYTITAKDASNCTVSSVVIITSSAILTINSVTKTNSTCFNPGNGTINISGSVSAGNPTYYLNNAFQTTSGSYSGLGPGTYTVSIYDANGCHKDSVVTITAPPPLYYTNAVIVYPPCNGGTGSISMQGIGGVPPYTYALNTGAYGGTFSWNNLPAGNYTVHLQDANGCIHDSLIYLIQPPILLINGLVLQNASCSGAATGSITVTPTGGTPAYSFALNTGAYGPTNSFTGLASGTYTVHVKDANNCPKDTVISINNNGNFKIVGMNKVSPSCYGGNDGYVIITVTGGISPYQYALNTGPWLNSNNFTGLTAGFYTLHAKDNSGCFADSVIYIGQPVQVGFSSINISPTLCFGTNTGAVSMSGTGGTPGFQYKVDAGAFGAASSFTNLAPGTHTVSVKDSKGCIKDSVITIGQPTPVGFTNVTVIPPGCFSSTGTITLAGTGGLSPYTYANGTGAYTSSGAFSNLPVGTYTLHVKDANGCTHDTIISISLNQLIFLNSLSYSPYICPGAGNGFISVIGSSANTPLSYSSNGGTPQTSGTFNGLVAGAYTIHIEDQLGCFIDTTLTIQTAPPIQIQNVILQSPLCYNTTNGSATINANGGLGSLKYAVNTGAYGTANTFSGLGAGTYTLHVKDSIGCVKDTIVNITAPAAITISSILIQPPYCSNAVDGSILITAAGGQSPYLYAINTSLYTTNNNFTNLFQGTYTVHIQDVNGCTKDTIIVLTPASYMNFINVVVTNVSCKYGNDGAISVGVSGGFSPYQYAINTISNGTSGSFGSLGIGSYTISVTDNIGCVEDTVLTVTEPLFPAEALLLNMVPNKCKGDSIGILTMGGTGGTPPYTYSIDGINFQTSPVFGGLHSGTYTLTVKDANGCIDDTTGTVTEPATSVQLVLLGIKDQSCLGVNDGAITVTTDFGVNPYTFYVDGTSKGADTIFQNLSPGEYIIEVIDSIGCKSTGKYTVDPSDRRPYIEIDSLRGVLCAGDKNGYLEWHARDCFPPYRYTFNTVPFGHTNYADGITNGSYFIQVTDTIGCYGDTTVTIMEGNPIDIQVVSTPASCQGAGDDGKASAQVIGGVSPFSFQWSGATTNDPDAINLMYGPQWAYVQDSLGCIDSVQFNVAYDPCCLLNLPNAFSPNGDDKNDIFRVIKYGNIKLVSLMVYDRWGNQVFKTTDIQQGWDGKYKGRDADVDTYFYLARYKCPLNDETFMLKGDVILVR